MQAAVHPGMDLREDDVLTFCSDTALLGRRGTNSDRSDGGNTLSQQRSNRADYGADRRRLRSLSGVSANGTDLRL